MLNILCKIWLTLVLVVCLTTLCYCLNMDWKVFATAVLLILLTIGSCIRLWRD